jgi:lipoprotein NlpD
MNNRWLVIVLLLFVAGCASRRPAPVVERAQSEAPPASVEAPKAPEPVPEKPVPTHTVKRGETLVGIALQYGLDYRELAAWNNITNPNVLGVGQVLLVGPPAGAKPLAAPVTTPLVLPGPPIEARPLANTANTKVEPRGQKVPFSEKAYAQLAAEAGAQAPTATPEPVPAAPVAPSAPVAAPPTPAPPTAAPEPDKAGTDREEVDWMWPVKGKVLAPFTETTKGMDLAGKKGLPVQAAAAGRVVYAGSGVRGYGNLIVIKHNNTWLSAYGHNDKLLVSEQQDVKKGQKIAEMGASDADQVKLHFEVRRQGKPVDPAKVLPTR